MCGSSGGTAGSGRRFNRMWLASTVSMLGDGMRVAVFPLLAVSVSRSPEALSAVTVAGRAPWLLFALFGGVLVDRLDRVRLLWLTGLVQAVLVGGFAAYLALGTPTIAALVVLSLLMGCAEIIYLTGTNALIPDLVPHDQLERANGRMQGSQIVAQQLAGPVAGAAAFGLAASAPIAIDAVSFLVAALLIRSLHRVGPGTSALAGLTGRQVLADIREGLRWLWTNRGIRLLAVEFGLAALALQLGTAMMVLLLTDTLRQPSSAFGIVLAVGAVGGVLASVTAGRLQALIGVTWVVVLSIAAMGISLVIAGAGTSVVLVAAMYTLGSFGVVLWSVQAASLRQRIVPRELMGRVGSVYRMIGWGSIPIGATLSGVLASAFGVRVPFFVGGALLLASLVLAPRIGRLATAATTDLPRGVLQQRGGER